MNTTQQLERKINKSYKSGNVKKAIELCQTGLKDDPTNADLHVRLGDLYLAWHIDISNSCQYIDDAITEYQRALESYIDSALVYFKIGQALFYKGDLDKSVNYLNTALSKNDKQPKAYYLLAQIYAKKARFQEAIDYVTKAIACSPFRASSARYLLASLYEVSSYKAVLRKCLAKWEYLLAILTFPFDDMALGYVSKVFANMRFFPALFKAYMFVQRQKYDEALEIYLSTIDKAPGFTPLYCLLGDVYLALGRFEDAITEYKMAIWLDTLNIPAYKHLCQAYEEQGDFDSAVDIYNKILKITPNLPEVHANLANILYVKGDIKGAISHFQTAVTLNPRKNWTSVVNQTLGFVFQESSNDLDAAISSYQSAYLLTPEDIDVYINLGSAFYDKEDIDNALAVYRNALELDPTNARIHCNLGFLHWGRGDLDEAVTEYELAIKYDPNYDIAYNNLGVIHLDDLGRVARAIELFRKSVECNPNYALAHFNLARAVTITGDKIEAAKLYQVAQDVNNVTNEMDPQEIADKINELFA